jgi:hypothetical protein
VNRHERRRAAALSRGQAHPVRKGAGGVLVTPYLNVPDFLVAPFWGLHGELVDEARTYLKIADCCRSDINVE